jgi:ribose transport system substrate-binding protein
MATTSGAELWPRMKEEKLSKTRLIESTRKTWLIGALLTAASVAVLVGTASTAAAPNATPQGVTADRDLVAEAKALVAAGVKGLVAPRTVAKPELSLQIADWKPVKKWVGPKSSAKAPANKKVAVIACATVAPFCANVARGAVGAAKALGWQATYIDGKATIQGYIQAFQTAMNMKPDAIIAMALPESQLASSIAEAHSRGIKVVGASAIPEKISVPKGHYDAYVSVREDSNALMQAWWVVADSNGKARVAWLWDPGYPFLVAELNRQKKILKSCAGCKIEEVAYRDFATAANPVRMQQLATGLLQRNPDVQYVLTPYGLNSRAIALAAHALGRKVKVVSKNADPINVGLVQQGILAEEVGASSEWGGWAAVDQTVRLLANKKPLGISQENQPEHFFVKSNAPASGILDFQKLFDFKGEYLRLWGRKAK